MKLKTWLTISVAIAILCVILAYAYVGIAGIALTLLGLNGLISLIIGIISIKKKTSTSVILIILGILSILFSYVLLISISQPHRVSDNSRVKAKITTIRSRAEIIYKETVPNSYETVCDNEQTKQLLDSAREYGKATKCFSDSDSFVATGEFKKPENQNTHWCADSTGTAKGITVSENAIILDANTMCPLTQEEISKNENDAINATLLKIHYKYNVSVGEQRSYFSQVCTSSEVLAVLKEVEKSVGEKPKCFSNDKDYIITVKLKNSIDDKDYYCVDSKFDRFINKKQNDMINMVKDSYDQCHSY